MRDKQDYIYLMEEEKGDFYTYVPGAPVDRLVTIRSILELALPPPVPISNNNAYEKHVCQLIQVHKLIGTHMS